MKVDFTNIVLKKLIKLFVYDKIYISFSHNVLNIEKLSNLKNKIIIIFRPGDHFSQQTIDTILQDADKRKIFCIFLMVHKIDEKNFILHEKYAKFFYIPSVYHFYSLVLPKKDITKNIKKHFISTNNRISFARTNLFFYLFQKNLLNKTYFTYLGEERGISFNECVKLGSDFYLNNFDNKNEFKYQVEVLEKLLPIYLDDFKSVIKNSGDWSINSLEQYYCESFLSIVSETFDGDTQYPFFTEKIWKPISMKQPFILINSQNSLAALHDLGFKTFNDIIDESYDKLPNPQRFEFILKEITRISNFSIDELQAKEKLLQNILEHNYNHFYDKLPEIFELEIEKIKTEIDTLIQNHIQYIQ